MKSYKLFLDDIRNPTDCTNYSTMFMPSNRNSFYEGDWIIVRTYNEFVYTIKELYSNGGSLDVISFDHDLADFQDNVEYTGVDCAKWLVDFLIANNINMPKFFIHSVNIIGANEIMNTLKDYSKYKKLSGSKI